MEKYCDTNLNYYIKIKLTEEGRIIYKKHYAKYNCEVPKLNIDDKGFVRFQIHDFMNIFGERLFMGATLPCETNCKIQVKDEWHYVKDGDLPTDKTEKKYLVALKSEYGGFFYETDIWCESLHCFASNNPTKIYAWKEIIPPKE